MDVDQQEVMQILAEAKVLARRYYRATQKPLGVTGEVAEFECLRLLEGLTLAKARQAGYDAIEMRGGQALKVQIKGRCVFNRTRVVGRMGSIDINKEFDTVLLVLLDENFNAFAIYEATRPDVINLITKPGSKSRNERGAVGINQFRAISKLRWPEVTTQV